MKKIYLLLMMVVLFVTSQAQLAVTVTNQTNTTPNLLASYPSLSAALTDLNAVTAMTGPVTLTLAAGSETSPITGFTIGSATLNPVLSATNSVLINTSGAAIINAAVGVSTPASTAPDGMLKIVGADYITIDGLTLTDANAANPATMEFGIALFKASLSDGAQNNTIKNCTISMQRINNVAGTAPMVEGAVGILVINSIPTAATTSLTPTAAVGTNSFNKFYSNAISGGNYGIALSGFAALTPFATGDAGNDIGGSSLATGNTILNFGGVAASTNPAAGIRANNQFGGINISYNTINNNNGNGANHVTTLRGIFAQAGTSASATINNNTVTIKSSATTSAATAIDNAIGSTAASNTININNNTIQNCTYATATTGTLTGILTSATATTVNTNGNTINGNSVGTAAQVGICIFQGIYNSGSAINYNASNNTITNNTILSNSGTMYCLRGSTSLLTWNNNIINTNSIPNNALAATTQLFGMYDLSSPTQENFANNQVNNLTIGGSSTSIAAIMGGMYFNTTASSVKNWVNNTVHTITYSSSSTGAATVYGIYTLSGNTILLSKNKVYNLSSTGASGAVNGLYIGSGTTITAINNYIGDLKTPAANATIPLNGINVQGGTTVNAYNNTIYLNTTSTGALFGSNAILASTSPSLNLRNNIFVNKSTPVGATGFTSAYRRSSTTLTTYAATSNNNLFYAGTPGVNNLIHYDGTASFQTLAAYKALVASRDAASVSEDPSFLSLVGSNPTFLHINTTIATQIESGGASIAAVTDDYDGDVRNATTPDIGADEFAGVPLDINAPSILYTPLTFTCASSARTLTATISDLSGVPTTGVGLPVLYWKINAGAYTAVTGTSIGSNQYTFTFGAGVVTADVISYYIVAQDNASTPNVGAFPSAGAAGFTANPPAASTAPTTPSFYTIASSLSGTYTVGTAGTYPTITAAINAYNMSCLAGPVIFSLIDATYTTTSDTIRVNPDASATNTLTIQPAVTSTITGNTTAATMVLLGADYVTIDGSIISGANTICPLKTSNRDLTIANSNVGTGSAIIWLTHNGTDGANNNTIKNCNITGNASTTTLIGIGSGGAGIGGAATTANNNNNSYINNNISKLQLGVYSAGISAALKNTGTTINQNLINTVAPNNVSRGGIAAFSENNILVSGNNISEIALSNTADAFGIDLGNLGITTATTTGVECTNAVISKNIIGSVRQTNTYSAMGILLAPGATGTSEISNNMISGVSANGTSGDFTVGIFVLPLDGSTTKVYYNTVSLSGTQTGGSDKSYDLAIAGGTTPTVDVKNNIFINKQNNGTGFNYAIGFGYTAFTNISSNNNDLFVATGATYSVGATSSISAPVNQLTLTNWQTTTSKDANSVSIDAVFVSATNLHLTATTNAALNASATPVSETTDIDCEARDASTPDIGADEFIYIAPTCAIPTALVNSAVTTLTASHAWAAASPVPAVGYEWAVTTSATPPASGAATTGLTASSTGLTPNSTYYLHVRSDCGAGLFSSWATSSSFYNGYCIFSGTSALSYLNAFSTTGGTTNITNSASGYSAGGYGNFTAQKVTQVQGGTINFAGTLVVADEGVGIWVDYNDNLTFETGERVYNSAGYLATLVGSFTVPASAPAGNHRMRVVMDYNATSPNACSLTSGRGEAEDYTLEVTVAPPCAGPISGGTATSSVGFVCGSGTTILNATGISTGTGLSYQWESSPAGANTFTPIASATTVPYTTASITASTDFRLVVTCANGPASGTSTITTITVTTTIVNDDVCNAINLVLDGATECGNTTCATSVGDPTFSPSTPNNTTWYKFTPTTTGVYEVNFSRPSGVTTGLLNGWLGIYSTIGTCPAALTFTEVSPTTGINFNLINNATVAIATPSLNAGTTYYFMMDGVSGAFGAYCINVKTVPTPPNCTTNTTPINGATGVTFAPEINLAWNAAPGATAYDLYFGTVNPPTTLIGTLTGTIANVTGGLGSTTYYWYVVPKNTGGLATGCASSVYSFTTVLVCNAPTAVATNSVTSTTANVTFTGAGTAFIAEYGPTGFVPGTGATAGAGTIVTGSSSPIAITGLTPSTAYQVYVRQDCTVAGIGYSPNSLAAAFTTLAPPVIPLCPVIVAPASAANVCASSGTILSWTASVGATSYDVYLDAGAGPTTTVVSTSQVGLTYNAGVLAAGQYTWKVIAKNSAGPSAGCANITFTILPRPTASITPSGTVSICAPSNQVYTATTDIGNTYQWKLNGANISGETASTYTATASGTYQVVVSVTATGCKDSSTNSILIKNTQPTVPSITPSPTTVCGTPQLLTASGSSAPNTILSENFNGVAAGTTISGNLPAGWTGASLTSGVRKWGVVASAQTGSTLGGGNFLYCESDLYTAFQTSAEVITPSFNATGYTSVNINFKQYYNDLTSGAATDSAKVYVSNDGGTSWVLQPPADYDTDQGTAFTGAGAISTSIALNAVSLSNNMKVRLVYNSDAGGNDWYWAVDDFVIDGIQNSNYSWAPLTGLFTDAAGTIAYTGTPSATVYANPASTATYTVTANSAAGCTNTANVTVTVLPPGVSTWTGAINTDWNNVGNWNCGGIPTITSEVVIPAGRPNYPVITLNVEIKKITVDPATSVTVATGFGLKLNGN
jgi:trimeric autotransporter adhesin